ncbi:MAG: repeat protein [Polyangiaceae bacterium]|nr:repeat protein [Polyangiaceae bacterium]
MKRRSSLWPWCLPLVLLGGCLLPKFDNVPASAEAEGGADNGGGAPSPEAGAGGQGAATTVGGAGAGNEPTPQTPEPVDDAFVVEQGKELKLTAAGGVLANDRGAALRVTSFQAVDQGRPTAYEAALEIAEDGSLTFTPQADYFGRYDVDYTVEAEGSETASARVTFVVQPVAVSLDAVQEGVGGVVLTGSTGDELGVSLAAVGDVNADGFDDFVVGAPGAGGGAGAVYVVFGRSGFGSLALGSLAASSQEARFAVLTGTGTERVGEYVAAAGRYDSDQVPDILIGSPRGGQRPDDGALYLAFGGSALKTTTALGNMPQGRGLVIDGEPFVGQRLGTLVAAAGDYDGNEKTDLLTGFKELGDAVWGIGLLLDLTVSDTTVDQVSHQTVTDTTFVLPLSLCFAGDVTGDGKDDILASSQQSIALLPGDGAGALVSDLQAVSTDGSLNGFRLDRPANSSLGAPVAPAGDVNGDGKADLVYCEADVGCPVLFGDIAVGRTLDDADWRVTGFEATLALPFVAPGSDLNQDDFSDLLFADEAAAYVVFGRDAGFGAVDVGSLGSDGFSLTAPSGGRIGAITTIGDVNGDGYGDFAASDPSAAGGDGRVYVVFGGPFAAEQR